MNTDQPQAKIPETRFHQVTIKVGERDQMPFMLNEDIGTGIEDGREITVARNVSGTLLLIALGKSNYFIDVGDIVQSLINYEDGKKSEKGHSVNRFLTINDLKDAIDQIKIAYPDKDMLKEIRLLDHKYIKKLVPNPPKENLPTAFGIPVLTDDKVPKNKIKLIYRDGREEVFDV